MAAPMPTAVAGEAAAHPRHPLVLALLALTLCTGLVDAVSFLGLGQVFVANMTGNVVLLGFGLAGTADLPVLEPIVSLLAFVAGSAVGGRLASAVDGRRPMHLTRALAAEVALLLVAAALIGLAHPDAGSPGAIVAIVLLAGAMGLRNAAVARLAVPDLSTTVLTRTLTALATGPFTGPAAARRALAVAAMALGAFAGALLVRTDVALGVLAATAVTAATGIAYARRFA